MITYLFLVCLFFLAGSLFCSITAGVEFYKNKEKTGRAFLGLAVLAFFGVVMAGESMKSLINEKLENSNQSAEIVYLD